MNAFPNGRLKITAAERFCRFFEVNTSAGKASLVQFIEAFLSSLRILFGANRYNCIWVFNHGICQIKVRKSVNNSFGIHIIEKVCSKGKLYKI